MNGSMLELPERTAKPRTAGVTMMVDGGLPARYFRDVIESAGDYLDLVKFGWGTAVVSPGLRTKIEVLRHHRIEYYLGGTLFEKHVLQDRFDDFRSLCEDLGCTHVEVSNGTIPLSNHEKAAYIGKLTDQFVVLSEVGFKDPGRSENLPPRRWIEYGSEDLSAGATFVILEARESGRSGICRPNGELRFGLIEELLTCGLPTNRLLFEAPTTALQAYFVERVGPDVNLGNVAASDLIGLETLRLGLRADTLTCFEPHSRWSTAVPLGEAS